MEKEFKKGDLVLVDGRYVGTLARKFSGLGQWKIILKHNGAIVYKKEKELQKLNRDHVADVLPKIQGKANELFFFFVYIGLSAEIILI